MTKFLAVDRPSTFNGVIGRPFLKALRIVTSIHCLTIKVPTAMGTGQVRGRQHNSKEFYNSSLELAEKEKELPQMMEVKKVNTGSMEMNIDPHL